MSYKRLGDYIKRVSIKNSDGLVDILYGINIDKFFMPSVANVIGTDLSRYKVVTKNQFACNRMHVGRDKRLPISLSLKNYDFIVSPAYDVFEITDTDIISCEYLMMWFTREEFDRNCWFHTDSDVRGKLDWDAFMDMELPIPSIEKQQQIVAEYSTVTNRIKLNENLNQKLEATAQALYKHWFVDFEFPNAENKPYKSSGGEMVYNEELDKDIPVGWSVENIEALCEIIDGDRGKNYPSQQHFSENGFCLFLNAGNVSKNGFDFSNTSFITKERDNLLRKGKLERNDTVLTSRGTVGNIAFYSDLIEFENLRINSGMVIFRSKEIFNSIFTYSLMRSTEMKNNIENFSSGSAQPQLPIKDIKKIPVLVPSDILVFTFSNLTLSIQNKIEIQNRIIRKLTELQSLLLAKMTQQETKPVIV
ncbi:restriction endonuclease subunit S [Tenacibaculum ovolyticum]|uniref:restriction endonuclease subunit S n=1 Tax=Tenacibaculum ovolyticum TaxID=104270 RepID=UPI0007EC770E|nr:restriction endonuclease subunit S [Tenacibaculum ovolyticum]